MVTTVTTDQSGVSLKDMRVKPTGNEKVLCKIAISTTNEYFLVENHQDSGFDKDPYNGKGLLIWHVKPGGYTDLLDIEVATTKVGTPPPGNSDWLDSLVQNLTWNPSSRKDDFFGPSTSTSSGKTSLKPHPSNPNTNTWHDNLATPIRPGKKTTLSILNIANASGTDMVFDVDFHYTPPSNETWEGEVLALGDVTVPSGKTLTVSAGTTVKFAAGKQLSVYGTLDAVCWR